MYFIVGLGNPEIKYYNTRHNVGFNVIDALLDELSHLKLDNSKFNGVYTKTKIGSEEVVIGKPLTYMNLSGEFIKPLADFYKIPASNILVCYDEVALDAGRIKLTKTGSSAGHNGIKSIISHLGTENFMKLRVGIGPKPSYMDLADFVLMRFTKEETEIFSKIYLEAAKEAIYLVEHGIDDTMNEFNRKV